MGSEVLLYHYILLMAMLMFRIQKLLKLCQSVHKWRLCIRFGDYDWTHPSGAWVMLGDSVHATLPYLASGYFLST